MRKTKCLWIIDDDRNDIELMESVISAHMPDITIRSFDNCNRVLAVIQQIKDGNREREMLPGLIILDLKMPVRDGHEMFKFIRSHEDLALTPVVIFSSSRMEKDIRKSYNLGVNAYVTKPVNFDDFEKVLCTMADFWLNTCEIAEVHQKE